MALHRAGYAHAERFRRKFQRSHAPVPAERLAIACRAADELLNETMFRNMAARAVIWTWAADFNETRPHSAFGYQTPKAFGVTPHHRNRRINPEATGSG